MGDNTYICPTCQHDVKFYSYSTVCKWCNSKLVLRDVTVSKVFLADNSDESPLEPTFDETMSWIFPSALAFILAFVDGFFFKIPEISLVMIFLFGFSSVRLFYLRKKYHC